MDQEMREHLKDGPLQLADGSLLFIKDDGTRRMVDKESKPTKMKEHLEM